MPTKWGKKFIKKGEELLTDYTKDLDLEQPKDEWSDK